MTEITKEARERIERIKKRVVIDTYPICIEKFKITLDVLSHTKNDAVIVQRGKILKATTERMPIGIEEDELIVGRGASRFMGLEIDPNYGIWSQQEIDWLKEDGFVIDSEDERELQRLNAEYEPDTLIGRMGDIFYEEDRIISLLKAGLILPPWKDKKVERGVGGGYAQSGLGLGPSLILLGVDYSKLLKLGTEQMMAQAREQMDQVRFTGQDSVESYRYLESVVMALEAVNTLADRYADLAEQMAQRETREWRRKELEQIADNCRHVPRKPAETFRQAIQCFWFQFLMLSPSTTLPGGRFDQYMYPYYKADIEAGRITNQEVVELLSCLRLKDMELNRTSGRNNRKKNAGMAKWHNFTIGGVKPDGSDASNELTYMMLDAAMVTKTPHHTLTVRVHDKTPETLMTKALEVVKMGLGMPAFIGDESYMKTFTSRGVSIEDARDYIMTGCLDANLPGKSRTGPVPMVTIPLIFDLFRHGGVDKATGEMAGIDCGKFTEFRDFESLKEAFFKEMDYCLHVVGEKNNIELTITQELLPDPLRSCLMYQGIESGKETFRRVMPFENAAVINPIGMVNVGDSLAAIRKLVFEEKKYSLEELDAALDADWEGFEEMRQDFLKSPKFGNNEDAVDVLTAECYARLKEICDRIPNIFGYPHIPTGISITSHQPGGALTGATPDGRKAGEILADGTMSPMHGMDCCGPLAVLQSAMKVDQDPMQATLLNMKFHPTALQTEDDLHKLSAMIRTYLTHGGKHIQFNVVDRATLVAAKENPREYRDLIVRIAGYSAYFVQLNAQMQDEVIARVEHIL